MAYNLWHLNGRGSPAFEPLGLSPPSNSARNVICARPRSLSRLCLPLLTLFILALTALFLYNDRSRPSSVLESNLRDIVEPSYEQFYEHERHLPQHDESLPFPEGKDGRYVWVSTQHWGLGWNNVFQAYCLLTQMAFMSNRAFAFQPYVWRREENGVAAVMEYHGEKRAKQIPLTAILGGPLGGGNLPDQYHRPRSVSTEWFHHVCPPNRTTVLHVTTLNEGLGDDAAEVMEKYVDVLLHNEANCVELRSDGIIHPFDWMQFGSPKLLNVWAMLSVSPFFTEFTWSPLVLSALPTNVAKLSHSFLESPLPSTVPGLLSVHLRRGDYDTHCQGLSKWESRYMGWNLFPSLPDKFNPLPKGPDGERSAEYSASYTRHCYPDTQQIINRIYEVRRGWKTETGEQLTHLFIMTNAEEGWTRNLIQQLHSTDKWEKISTARDLTLTVEQTYVSQIIDMAIGERASVFLGNGFSSFTANIVFLRSLRNVSMRSNRFW